MDNAFTTLFCQLVVDSSRCLFSSVISSTVLTFDKKYSSTYNKKQIYFYSVKYNLKIKIDKKYSFTYNEEQIYF